MSKTVYLFSRCSTLMQAEEGDSLRRQQESTITWIERDHANWNISDKSFVLEGISGFDGSSLGLGGFIDACESGEIIYGKSVLAIEAVDRLSRLNPNKGRMLWLKILDTYGVDIAVARWGIVFKHDDGDPDMGNDLMLTAALHLARMESQQKSQRIKAVFERRRAQSREKGGKKRTSVCPSWLKLSEDHTEFLVIPEKVKLLERIFDMKLNKSMGPDAIARNLTDEGVETLRGNSQKWSRTILRKYLTSEACIGHFQPQTVTKELGKRVYKNTGEVIKNYYPAVINEDIYWATQKTFKTSNTGRKGRFTNLLKGLTKCPECYSNMSILISKRKNGEAVFIKCNQAIRGSYCQTSQIRYHPLEDTLVKVLSILDYSKLSRKHGASTLEKEIDDLSLHRDAISGQLDNELNLASMANESLQPRIMAKANDLDGKLISITEDIATKKAELLSLSTEIKKINLKIDDYESRHDFNKFISNYVELINPKKDVVRIVFKGQNAGCVIKYGDDPEKVVETIYKARTLLGVDMQDYGESFVEDPKYWENVMNKANWLNNQRKK